MQIELSKAEYRTLLGVLEIAHWVLFAHRSDRPADRQAYRDFEQKVFGHAEAFGCGDLIEYVEQYKEYFPTAEYEENSHVQSFIDEFENHNFWAELLDRLAARDMFRELGEEEIEAMDDRERLTKRLDYESRYNEEFQKHGVERLEITE